MRFNINKQIKEKTESVSEFLKDNKEIFIKNFITQLLKSEKAQIKSRKKNIEKALNDSTIKLDNDYKAFINYIDSEKEKYKFNENVCI